MGAFAHVTFSSPGEGVDAIAAALVAFVRGSPEWRLQEAQSAEYAKGIGHIALIIEGAPGTEYSNVALAIAEAVDQRCWLQIWNIIPRRGELTVKEYNTTARHFVAGFRRFAKKHRVGTVARVKIASIPTDLRRIIPGARTRTLFERFLAPGFIWETPTTTHPNDIKRLDTFICAIHRYHARVHLPALRDWLMSERRWPREDADWTCGRIEVGSAILRVNHGF
jgi:hypothetical protein